ncbi:hypothetical protein [Candidatus Nitrososphaera gargensis]|uniref:hypothetical protein n=1 Tax=Candidatus Nitrososphaera gargensis TaxID=497727 RepID=UPI0011E5464E|nr:hypothetical protein [Candidatus Nitrososphaera gargensis]
MQTARTDLELRAEMPDDIGVKGRIQMPARMCIATTAAVAGGAIAAGLILEYYLRKRRNAISLASS